eukprot:scaffold204128_cov13-Tisochrysis_lutea.AAC.1
MHEMLDFLQRRSNAPTPALAPHPSSMSDSRCDSRVSSINGSGCSSAGKHEPAQKKLQFHEGEAHQCVCSRVSERGV